MASTRNINLGPGAMAGVSQLQMYSTTTPPSEMPNSSGRRQRQREAGSTHEVMLDARQVQAAWRDLNVPEVRQCINEISKRLFAGEGVVATHGQEMLNVSEVFGTYLKRDMSPFAQDALNAMLVYGVVPIAFRRPRTAGLGPKELAPFVPKFGTYVLTTWAEVGMQHYAFYWSNLAAEQEGGQSYAPFGSAALNGPYGERDDSVFIAHDMGFEPNLNGSLTSNMHTISTLISMVRELRGLALTGERISANPALILGYNPHVDDQAEKDFGEGFYVGDPDRCQRREDAVYERDSARRAELADQLRTWSARTGMDPRAEFGDAANVLKSRASDNHRAGRIAVPPAGGTDFSGAEMPWAHQYRLGVTDQLVNHQLPRTRTDYTDIVSQTMDIVCGVLNVPRGMLASESSIRAGVEANAEAMNRTVNWYADTLSKLMTGVYNHLFGVSDLRDELRIRVERRRRRPEDVAPQLLTERDLIEARAKMHIRLKFDLPPPTTQEALNFMHDRGILAWSTYGEATLRLNGFSRDQLDSPKDPLNVREQRVMLLGNNADPPAPPASAGAAAGKKRKADGGSDHGQKVARTSIDEAAKKNKGK